MCRSTSLALAAILLLCGCSNPPASGLAPGTGNTAAQPATAVATTTGSSAASHQQALAVAEHSHGFRTSLDAQRAGYYGVGAALSRAEIAGWDIDIRPDGKGLPPGAGTAEIGEPLYEAKCADCHGVFGEGQQRWPKLAGDEPLTDARPERTVGNFWPYATTLWDYVHRAMPFFEPQSLNDNEVYAIVAYVLYLNDLLDYEQEINQHNLAAVHMPNAGGFTRDPRPDTDNSPCMRNCKDPALIKITGAAANTGVTPQ